MKADDQTIWRTPVPSCPACGGRRLHLPTEWVEHHHFRGHGFDHQGWSDPMLAPLLPLNLKGAPDPEENPS